MKKKLVRFDWAIKNMLRNKANFAILEGFLSELLFEDIKIHKILESESNQKFERDKFNRVDILVENTKKELIIVEVQNTYEIDYFQRMLYATSKAVSENIEIGKPYKEVKKIISINIVYFEVGQGKDYIYKGKTSFEGLHKHDILGLSKTQKSIFLKESVSGIFPEYYLIKVNNFNDLSKDTLDEWIYFLKNSEIKSDFKAKGIKEASKKLEVLKLSKEDRIIYDKYLDDLRDKASEAFTIKSEKEFAVEEALKKAEIQKKEALEKAEIQKEKEILEIVKNLILAGISNEIIHKSTNLSIEIIEKLRNKK